MRVVTIDKEWATVGAQEDIDGFAPQVVLHPNQKATDEDDIKLVMTPVVARRLARRLNRWAKLVQS